MPRQTTRARATGRTAVRPWLPCCLVVLALVSGCGRGPRGLLVGRWVSEAEFSQLPDGLDESEQADLPPRGIVLAFYNSGALQTQTRQGQIQTEKNGSWELLYFDPQQKSAVIRCQLMGQTTEHEVELIGDDAIRLRPPNLAGLDQILTFQRAK